MRKRSSVLLLAVLVSVAVMCSCAYAASYYEEGNDGSSWETAYIIDSPEDFMLMRTRDYQEEGKYYKLTTDLDLRSQTDWHDGTFTRHFDGQNHTITIDMSDSGGTLFGNIEAEGIAIRNLKVKGTARDVGIGAGLYGSAENCSFTGIVEGTNEAAGGLFGAFGVRTTGNIEIKNCTFQGEIRVSGTNPIAGGIVAFLAKGTIDNCTVLEGSTITCTIDEVVPNAQAGNLGGIVGLVLLSDNRVTNCNTTDVQLNGASVNGGIAGLLYETSNTTFSGNTWPSAYPEIGYGSADNNSGSTNTNTDNGNINTDPGDDNNGDNTNTDPGNTDNGTNTNTDNGNDNPGSNTNTDNGNTNTDNGNTNADNNNSGVGSSGGGCNEGFGVAVMLGLLALRYSKRH